IGELAEVTVALPPTAARPVISNASVQQRHGQLGVWVVTEDRLRFAPVKLGATDLDGRVQILEGLKSGERIVVHSQRPLETHSRFSVVNRLPGITP
ncbi:MAG: efflux transporter periplasmic adaptor subunit, partial [Betaproteobacteria bacterium]